MDRLAFNDPVTEAWAKLVKQARPTTFHGGADSNVSTLNAVIDQATAHLVPCALYPVSLEDSR